MNPPNESGPQLAVQNHTSTPTKTIQRHANEALHLALGLANSASVDDRDAVSKACEAIVLELACITSAQDLELSEILPAETCLDCGRPCLDFKRSRSGGVTCLPCLIAEAEEARAPSAVRCTRNTVLDDARRATTTREAHHGAPTVTFERIADLWSIILRREVLAHEVALCLAGLKIARAVQDPEHADNWVDLAGYAACGGEVALARRPA